MKFHELTAVRRFCRGAVFACVVVGGGCSALLDVDFKSRGIAVDARAPLDVDPRCATSCSAPVHGSPVCERERCSFVCDEGYHIEQAACEAGDSIEPDVDALPQAAPGWFQTCAIAADRRLWCWGSGVAGATGLGTSDERLVPTRVAGMSNMTSVASSAHSCASDDDGNAFCWGSNEAGQLGLGLRGNPVNLPQRIAALDDVAEVVTGAQFSCARTHSGDVYCWGSNEAGQLGTGQTSNDVSSPTRVLGIEGARRLYAGGSHACVIASDWSIRCWGDNRFGQLAIGSAQTSATSPVRAQGVGSVVRLAAAQFSTCALKTNGDVLCWGQNDRGQAGQGMQSATPEWEPRRVAGLRATGLAAGMDNFCARVASGKVFCWGDNHGNFMGLLGAPTVATRPTEVAHLGDVLRLYAGDDNLCAVNRDNRLLCWGLNGYGEVGNGSKSSAAVSVPYLLPAL